MRSNKKKIFKLLNSFIKLSTEIQKETILINIQFLWFLTEREKGDSWKKLITMHFFNKLMS